ncbi:MAG: CvpA family protein [Chthoniobacteraceae bacterium]|jgi:hypothetical protein
MDRFQLLFLGGSGLLVLVQSIRGWRVGVARQLVNIAALMLAYGAAIVSGRLATPLLRPLGYPDVLTSVIAGSVFGCAVYVAVVKVCGKLFRRTGEQTLRLKWLGYGAGGSALGFASALVTVWLSVFAIRCLGTVAEAEVKLANTPEAQRQGMAPSALAIELAECKHSLDSGAAGAVISETQPDRIYLILNKMAEVISSVNSMQRFVSYPGTKVLSQNPKIVALQQDPEIARQVVHRNFVALLGNPKIVAALNDPGLEEMVRSFELEKALDYALAGSSRQSPKN